MINNKFFFAIIFVFIVTSAILFLAPYSRLNDKVAEGDLLMKQGKAGSGLGGALALNRYKQANEEWPILKINLDFQQKLGKAKEAERIYKTQQPALEISLKSDAVQADIEKFVNKIRLNKWVTKAEYISEKETIEKMKTDVKNNRDLANMKFIVPEGLTGSIKVYMSDWSKISEIVEIAKDLPFIKNMTSSPIPNI